MTLLTTFGLDTEYGTVRVADRPPSRTASNDHLDLNLNLDGGGPPLVFVHGYPDNLQIWSRVIELLPNRRCIAFDWPGLGHSDPITDGATPFHLGRHLLAVLDAMGVDEVVPVGFDMGAHAVIAATATAPERIHRLVLCNFLADGSVKTSPDIAIMRRLGLNRLILRYGAAVVMARAQQTFLDDQKLDPETRHDLWSGFQRHEVRTHLRRMCAGYQAALPRITRLYPEIATKTLVVWASGDSHFPLAQGQALSDALGDATMQVVEAKHWLMWERPQTIARLIDDFLASKQPGGS